MPSACKRRGLPPAAALPAAGVRRPMEHLVLLYHFAQRQQQMMLGRQLLIRI
jgi:hypothetical protein